MTTEILWTTDDLPKLGEVFPGRRMELIEGVLYDKMGQKPPHSYLIMVLTQLLTERYGGFVRVQLPIALVTEDKRTSEPEPDLVVTKNPPESYRTMHPTPGEIKLLVEVADSSTDIDYGVKLALYARNGIGEYWIVDVPNRMVTVCREPSPAGYAYRKAWDGTWDELSELMKMTLPK